MKRLLFMLTILLSLFKTVAEESLIVYFSTAGNTNYSESVDANTSASINIINETIVGNTEIIAKWIEDETDGDRYLIEVVNKYPESDSKTHSIGRNEKRKNFRPELKSMNINIDKYDTIYLGFPLWWYDIPMAVYTFMDSYDLNEKKIKTFITHGGSGQVKTIQAIKKQYPNADIAAPFVIYRSDVKSAQGRVIQWIQKD